MSTFGNRNALEATIQIASRRRAARRLPDVEATQALRFLLEDLDPIDVGAARAFLREPNQRFDRLGLALEHRLDCSVSAIVDPAGDAPDRCRPAERVAEADTLNVTVDDDTPTHRPEANPDQIAGTASCDHTVPFSGGAGQAGSSVDVLATTQTSAKA
jgi:hypothetical protein